MTQFIKINQMDPYLFFVLTAYFTTGSLILVGRRIKLILDEETRENLCNSFMVMYKSLKKVP
jgi:hypothetical protein